MWPFRPFDLSTHWARNKLRAIDLVYLGVEAASKKKVFLAYISMYGRTDVRTLTSFSDVLMKIKPYFENRIVQLPLKDNNWECTLVYEADVQGREEE